VTGAALAGRTRAIGEAEAAVQTLKVESIGQEAYARIQIATALADHAIRLVPEILVNGGGGSQGSGMVDALLGMMVKERLNPTEGATSRSGGA
jgi:uncharacterized membrane protein YqiK